MQFLKKISDFYIDASIHIGFSVFCLVKITIISNELHSINYFPTCVFFATVLGYNFLKYFEIFMQGKFYAKKYFGIVIVSCIALLGFLITFYFQNYLIQKYIVISGFLVLIYPFLRKYGWLKLFLVSFVITYITVFIPYQTEKWLLWDFDINLIQRFLFITSLMVPFEIFDSKTDAISMNTLPQLLGVNRTKLLGILLLIPFIILEFLKVNPYYLVIPIAIIVTLFISYTSLDKSKYYTSFWVESVPVLWLILLLFTK